jgi:hypothetical protein
MAFHCTWKQYSHISLIQWVRVNLVIIETQYACVHLILGLIMSLGMDQMLISWGMEGGYH